LGWMTIDKDIVGHDGGHSLAPASSTSNPPVLIISLGTVARAAFRIIPLF
jgi:hypothetical protein